MKSKVTVLLDPAEFERLDAYCESRGFKKSTLIARLVRDHMDGEAFQKQVELFDDQRVLPQPLSGGKGR